jgi:hypothetical protein
VIVLRQDGGASGEQRARRQRPLSAAFAPDPD